jgi:glycosyltransferase involved in cell wall biosynthesis
MLRAWKLVVARRPDARLTIIGQGPLADIVDRGMPGLRWLRQLPREQVEKAMLAASALLFPSSYYEGFPMVIAESFAAGLPVIAARIGAAAELIREGETGRLWQPGDPRDLAAVLEQALSDQEALRAMGREARREYEAKYTPQENYRQLMQVYALAAERAGF